MVRTDLQGVIADVLSRTPAWVRSELISQDSSIRSRAEETLAAMIAAAITEGIRLEHSAIGS